MRSVPGERKQMLTSDEANHRDRSDIEIREADSTRPVAVETIEAFVSGYGDKIGDSVSAMNLVALPFSLAWIEEED